MLFQLNKDYVENHVPYHHLTYQLNPRIFQVLLPNQENQLSKWLKKIIWSSNTNNTQCCYKSYEEFVKRLLDLKLSSEWNILQIKFTSQNWMHTIWFHYTKYLLGKVFQIRVLAWVLPDNHDIYGQYNSSCENVFLSNLVYSLNSYNVCQGISHNLSIDYYSLLVKHYMSIVFIPFQGNKLPLHESIFYRSNECSILTETSLCIGCSQKQGKLLQSNNKSVKRKSNSLTMPL